MGAVHQIGEPLAPIVKTQDISFLSISETKLRGTVCGKSARTGLWGSGEVMSRSTRTLNKFFTNEAIFNSSYGVNCTERLSF